VKWVPYPFQHDGSRMMAIGHQDYVYVVGTWHGRDNWQGSKFKDGRWKVDSRSFHGPDGSTRAREWCETQNRRHAPRKGRT
jgi:photosystem II stability/assembly factor-like uncharacterized protein